MVCGVKVPAKSLALPIVETPTLLFTDIEGSTALYERVGEVYRQALALHDVVIRECLERHRGRRIRHTGDGMIAAFDDPVSAVRCASELRSDLAQAPWPEATGPLRVRMGLHYGEADFADGDYHGLTMHHAARVMSAARGGQILCSASVAERLPSDGWPLHDWGLYRLRGVPRPMRLFEVIVERGKKFAAPNVPPAFTHRLPGALTRYFGREAEIAELCALLHPRPEDGPPRLVTLLGPGGNGKSRLSLEVAARLQPAFSHAVWFIPLADLREPSLVLERIRAELDLPAESGTSALELCARYLREQPALLILDNYEQLLPDGAEPIIKLMSAVPLLCCLVTSRTRLNLSFEVEFRLAPLRLPVPSEAADFPAVQLFLDRARLVRRDFSLTAENTASVADLCVALEGIPLAIELAAARSAVLSPRQMLERLSARLDFLASRRSDVPERHRTLRSAIGWSFDLLTEEQGEMFVRLSVFRGGWTLEAAEAVCGGESATLDLLAELQGCSLVNAAEVDGAMRYTMLEVLRDFASERLEATAATAAWTQHHTFFFALCKNTEGLNELAWHRRVARETNNLRALLGGTGAVRERLRAAVCLYPFWMHRGTLQEGRGWLRQLRAEHGPVIETTGAAGANAAAILAWKAGDYAAARADFEVALTFWQEQRNEKNVAGLLNNLAILEDDAGDLVAAQQFYERCLAIYRAVEAEAELPAALGNLGQNALRRGDLVTAERVLLESDARARVRGDFTELANATHNLAELALRQGRSIPSRKLLAESFALRGRLESRDNIPDGWLVLSEIALRENLSRRAALCLFAAEAALEAQEERMSPESMAALARHAQSVRAQLPAAEIEALRARAAAIVFTDVLATTGEWQPSDDMEA